MTQVTGKGSALIDSPEMSAEGLQLIEVFQAAQGTEVGRGINHGR